MNFSQSSRHNRRETTPVEFILIATIIAFALIAVLTPAGTAPAAGHPASARHPL